MRVIDSFYLHKVACEVLQGAIDREVVRPVEDELVGNYRARRVGEVGVVSDAEEVLFLHLKFPKIPQNAFSDYVLLFLQCSRHRVKQIAVVEIPRRLVRGIKR